MIWEDLNENLIVPDLEAKSSDEVFEKLGGLFIAEGYCRDTYVDALKDRERFSNRSQYGKYRNRNSSYR